MYEGWSSMQSLDITNVDMTIETDFSGRKCVQITDDISLPTNFKDAYSSSARLGLGYLESLNIRQGLLFEATGQA